MRKNLPAMTLPLFFVLTCKGRSRMFSSTTRARAHANCAKTGMREAPPWVMRDPKSVTSRGMSGGHAARRALSAGDQSEAGGRHRTVQSAPSTISTSVSKRSGPATSTPESEPTEIARVIGNVGANQ
eukprot:4863530-Heterocapsa_arctica.AAC.1